MIVKDTREASHAGLGVLVEEECSNCHKTIFIDSDLYNRLERNRNIHPNADRVRRFHGEHTGFFVSEGGYYYCSRNCAVEYTLD